MKNQIVYAIHWLRRWWKTRRSPLTRLLYDPVLDGPPAALVSERVSDYRERAQKAWETRRRERHVSHPDRRHTGPLRTLGEETFCIHCGVGVDAFGFYDRGATSEGARLTNDQVAKSWEHYLEQPAAD